MPSTPWIQEGTLGVIFWDQRATYFPMEPGSGYYLAPATPWDFPDILTSGDGETRVWGGRTRGLIMTVCPVYSEYGHEVMIPQVMTRSQSQPSPNCHVVTLTQSLTSRHEHLTQATGRGNDLFFLWDKHSIERMTYFPWGSPPIITDVVSTLVFRPDDIMTPVLSLRFIHDVVWRFGN